MINNRKEGIHLHPPASIVHSEPHAEPILLLSHPTTHLQQPNNSQNRTSTSTQHRKSSRRSTRITRSGVARSTSSRIRRIARTASSRLHRTAHNARTRLAGARGTSVCIAGRRGISGEDGGAGESPGLVLVVGVVVEVGRCCYEGAGDEGAGGAGGYGAAACGGGGGRGAREGRAGEAAGADDFVYVWKEFVRFVGMERRES